MSIRHVSFDFWNTIGIANKTFAKLRSEILSEFSETTLSCGEKHRHSPEYCRAAYTYVKQEMDMLERSGAYFSTDTCFARLVDHLEVDYLPYHRMSMLQAKIWEAFYNCPPVILPEVQLKLKWLKNQGYTLSIGSNTNFIPGQIIIDSVLYHLNVFDYYIFSDEIGCSKPAIHFFDKVVEGAANLGHNMDEILHIGDSKVFDYDGATHYGLKSYLIPSPHELESYLKTL